MERWKVERGLCIKERKNMLTFRRLCKFRNFPEVPNRGVDQNHKKLQHYLASGTVP
jgi:hypothetical protein